MNFEELKRAINIRETIKLYAILLDKYSDYVQAYSAPGSQLHRYWKDVMEPQAMAYSGDSWGRNPRLPTHPVGYALMERNGLLPNQPKKKEDEDFVF